MNGISHCVYCGREVNPGSRYTYTRIVGWHRPGKAGGSDITLREKQDAYACSLCIDRIRSGVNPGQEAMPV